LHQENFLNLTVMKNNSLTKIHGTGFSSGADTEKKLKFFAVIVLALCVVILIATRESLPQFLNFLLK